MRNTLIQVKQYLKKFNLFESRASVKDGDTQALHTEIITTRLFLILLSLIISVLLIYLSSTDVTQNILVRSPSIEVFERLYKQYSATLVCPCSQSTVRYDQFITVKPIYHEVR